MSVNNTLRVTELPTYVGTGTANDVVIAVSYGSPGDGGGGEFYVETPPSAAATIDTVAMSSSTVTGATNDPQQPIVITTSTSHGFVTGQSVLIAGVGGNTAANGAWIIN